MIDTHCVDGNLKFDEACIELKNEDEESNMWVYSLSSDCVSCPYTRLARISRISSKVRFNTARPMQWAILNTDDNDEYLPAVDATSNALCTLLPNIGQYGYYELLVRNSSCIFKTIKRANIDPYIELSVVFVVIICFLLGLSIARIIWNVIQKILLNSKETRTVSEDTKKHRIKSIDTFRGISILFMIFVNDGGGGYYIMEHATWNGLLIGDLVFPCFIWIMGFCIPMALSSQKSRSNSKYQILLNVIKRSILLFLIGISLNTLGTAAQLEKIRIFGVLQRFAIGYLVVASIVLFLRSRSPKRIQSTFQREFQDISILSFEWCIILCIVFIHCLVIFTLPIPGCPTGYLGPGGRHENGKYKNCTGGATGYIDTLILTPNHMFKRLAITKVYGSGPFDPEGILGCLTTIFHVFLGVQAGQILLSYKNWKDRVVRWLLWAIILGIAGSTIHYSNLIPVNKNLWSLSFVFITSSFAFALLSACYLLVDVTGIWYGGPFRIPGMNALVMYIGHSVCYQIFPFHWKIGNMNSHVLHLVEAIWGVALWTIIAYIMHHKRTYIAL